MAVSLSGFPGEGLDITLGPKWVNTVNSLTSTSSLTLGQQTGTSILWKITEKGTTGTAANVPSRTTNRMGISISAADNSYTNDVIQTRIFGPDNGTGALANLWAAGGSGNEGNKKMIQCKHFSGTANSTQNFSTWWISATTGGDACSSLAGTWFGSASPTAQFNGLLFSSLAASGGAGTQEINVVSAKDSTSIADGTATTSLDDGTDFGYIRESSTESDPVATFNIENLGADDLSITSITVPTGFTIDASGDLDGTADTVGSYNSKTLVVGLDRSAAAGVKSGNVTITSDDADEGTYTFAVTGIVSDETVGSSVNKAATGPVVLKTNTPCKRAEAENYLSVAVKVHIPGIHKNGEFALIAGGETAVFTSPGDNIEEVFASASGSGSIGFNLNNLGT